MERQTTDLKNIKKVNSGKGGKDKPHGTQGKEKDDGFPTAGEASNVKWTLGVKMSPRTEMLAYHKK